MLGSAQDAEDLAQETLLRAWRALERFEPRVRFQTWLYRIATNACLDELERRPRRPEPIEPFPDRPADATAASHALRTAPIVRNCRRPRYRYRPERSGSASNDVAGSVDGCRFYVNCSVPVGRLQWIVVTCFGRLGVLVGMVVCGSGWRRCQTRRARCRLRQRMASRRVLPSAWRRVR